MQSGSGALYRVPGGKDPALQAVLVRRRTAVSAKRPYLDCAGQNPERRVVAQRCEGSDLKLGLGAQAPSRQLASAEVPGLGISFAHTFLWVDGPFGERALPD